MGPTLAWAGILAAMTYLPLTEDRPNLFRSVVKALPLLLFSVAAYVTGQGVFLIAGLVLSSFGDFALSRDGEAAFLYGLASFALAHLLYILHFMQLAGAPLWEAFWVNPAMAIFLVAYGILAEIWLVPYAAGLRLAVRVYVVLITLMGIAALAMPIGLAFVGAAFFIASDTLLALQMFRMAEENPLVGRIGWAVWISYIAGQAMIMTASVPLSNG
ncbi:lysoplasmalogenase family protein [Maritimibacter dapengensis]|uniref:Lysoplasmalogenase n=1 Tax=Maritimibacter dapengensis TaxID=2836868 RepID=A0ABS6SY62_9RHOB|nr:lysoplasmalogenase [Maritimibacter dapengensis]MBV7377903.1 lysoplasmalogenase [Maritimibacter dapengensis]